MLRKFFISSVFVLLSSPSFAEDFSIDQNCEISNLAVNCAITATTADENKLKSATMGMIKQITAIYKFEQPLAYDLVSWLILDDSLQTYNFTRHSADLIVYWWDNTPIPVQITFEPSITRRGSCLTQNVEIEKIMLTNVNVTGRLGKAVNSIIEKKLEKNEALSNALIATLNSQIPKGCSTINEFIK